MVAASIFRKRFFGARLSGLIPAKANTPGIVFSACASIMVGSLLLGGGTRGGFLSDAILELLAIPALVVTVSSFIDLPRRSPDIWNRIQWVLMFCFAIVLLPLFQLAPLPPWIWTRLPGREGIEAIFELVAGQRNWMPVSVSPNATWLSFLSLLPPMTIFLGTIQLSYQERRRLSLVIIAVGIVSAFVGLIQVSQGSTSPLRFFVFTNNTEAVGFFANRNHFAALLYSVLLFTAAWAADIAFKTGSWTELKRKPARIVAPTVAFIVIIVLVATEAMARSRAGLVLTIAALAGVFALGAADRRNASGARPSKLLLGATILAIILTSQFALYRVLDRFAVDPLQNARIPFAHNTIEAATAFTPFGAGLGTFVPVYGMFEKPSDTIVHSYANHAHNDVLEMWLETGVMGMALVGLFVIWLGFRFVKLWWRSAAHASELDHSLMRAATVVIGLLIAHSLMDYPLRTGAMMAVFAFACALLIEPSARAEDAIRLTAEPSRVGVSREQAARVLQAQAAGLSQQQAESLWKVLSPDERRSSRKPGERWGEDIDWPEEWCKPKEQKPPESNRH